MHRWLWALWLIAWDALPASAAELVRDGQPVAETVVGAGAAPSVKTAAAELQKYLKKMSGAELPIVAGPSGATAVYVGASPNTRR